MECSSRARAHTRTHSPFLLPLSPFSSFSHSHSLPLSLSLSFALYLSLPALARTCTHTHERKYLSDFCEASQGEIEHDARVVKSREAWDNLSKDECGYPMDMEDAHPPPRTIEHQTRETLSQFNYE